MITLVNSPSEYTFDLRPFINYASHNEFIVGNDEHDKVYRFENHERPNIAWKDVEPGMHMYYYGVLDNEGTGVYEVEITHIYGGVVFWKYVNYPYIPERHCDCGSYCGMHEFYPYRIIINNKAKVKLYDYPSEYVKIIMDNDESTIGTYTTTYTKETFNENR